MEKINELITSIIEISFDNLPVEEGWGSYEINAYALRKMIEINAFYLQNDGKKISFNPKYQGQVDRENDLTFLFMDLRKNMYESSPNQGAWYSCSIIVHPSGKFDTKFNYEDKPNLAYEPSKDKFEDDIKAFPREESLVPIWLKEILNS